MGKFKTVFLSVSLSITTILFALPLSAQARFDDPTATSQPGVQLGEIQVTGQKQLIQALQAIKVALKRPESTDASQRDTIVCRLEQDIGTHQKDLLTCATNATLQKRREDTQLSILLRCSEMLTTATCMQNTTFGSNSGNEDVVLGKVINASSEHILKMQVDGAALRKLLASLPAPAPVETIPVEAGSTPAPAAATSSGH